MRLCNSLNEFFTVFHMVHKYISKIPESCILICLGLVIGGVAYAIDDNNELTDLLFNPDVFFLYILPPIVMEAGYFMPKEPFFANLGTILTFAIFGTIFNTVTIGLSLYGVYQANLMPGKKCSIQLIKPNLFKQKFKVWIHWED